MLIKETNYKDKDFTYLCKKLEQEHINTIKEQRSPNANCLNNLEKFTKVFIAYDTKAVGCLAMKEKDIVEVGRLYVEPKYRNKGIATELFKQVEEQAKKIKAEKIILDTYDRFDKAIKLYKKLGFKEIDNYIENSPYSVCMEKKIDCELLDVYDEDNNCLGYSLERTEIHEKKLWHRHASAWIMNKEGKVLLQQRAFTKKKNPGKWARTGGHVDAGETCEQAVKREVYEEIGLKVDGKIENFEIFKNEDGKEKYFTYGYIFITDLKEEDFKLQKEEVNAVKYFSIEELEEARKQNNIDFTFCKWDEEGFKKQMAILKEYRDKIKEGKNG